MDSRSWFALFVVVLIGSAGFLLGPVSGQTQSGAPARLIREEQLVVVDGIPENWRLQWSSEPSPVCPPADDTTFTCPCEPFAYGEAGTLDLVRLRNGQEYERLALTPLFEESIAGTKAVLQRWPVQDGDADRIFAHRLDSDWSAAERREIEKRSLAKIMKLADFDHDGKATEFFLPVADRPCGKSLGVVIGVSPRNTRLHVFDSVATPGVPLQLFAWEWEALQKSSGPSTVVEWRCGDHGAEVETLVQVQATTRGIQLHQEDYECTDRGRGKLTLSKDR